MERDNQMKSKLNQTDKQGIYEAYMSGMRVTDIAEMYGVNTSTASHVAKVMGATPRRPKVKHDAAQKVCPTCKKTIEVKGAKFCCFCGADIRSPRELLIARIEAGMPKLKYLPDDIRDDMHKLLLDIRNELSKGAEG